MRKGAAVALLSCVLSGQAQANSCSNVALSGSYTFVDKLQEGLGLSAAGTFRVEGEEDESAQPMFNLTQVACDRKQANADSEESVVCRVTRASVNGQAGDPDVKNPSCFLDLDVSTFAMKEIAAGILAGVDANGSGNDCFETTLTIDKNLKRVSLSYTKTIHADGIDKARPGTCGDPPPQVLMNCTAWVSIRAGKPPSQRLCDFSSD